MIDGRRRKPTGVPDADASAAAAESDAATAAAERPLTPAPNGRAGGPGSIPGRRSSASA